MTKQINIRISVSEVEALIHEVLHTPRGSPKDTPTSTKLATKLTKQFKEQQHASNRCDCCAELWSVCHCSCYKCRDLYRDCRLNCLD